MLNDNLQNDIQDYAYKTEALGSYLKSENTVQSVYLSNLGKLYQRFPLVVGISPNYMNVSLN